MLKKEILGIYLGEHQIEYELLKRSFKGWERSTPPLFTKVPGKNDAERLRGLLAQISPKRSRIITIAIPRTKYYLRELKFPGLTPEEAENAVKISINVHSHIPPEKIYYDCFSYERNGISRVLLAYCKRPFIDSILEEIKNTGHQKSLFCISPCSLGTDILLRKLSEMSFPCISLQREEEKIVVNLHGPSFWEGSHFLNNLDVITAKYGENTPVIPLEKGLGDTLDQKLLLKGLPKFENSDILGIKKWTLGLSASILGTSSYPQISFKPGPRKRPLSLRIDTYQILLVGLITILFAFSGLRLFKLTKLGFTAKKNQEVITVLEKKYKPLKSKDEELQKIRALQGDLKAFLKERPNFLDVLKELAEKTPKNAWIKYLTLRDNKLRISAEGGYAVQTMEAWRKSRLFSQVKLASPVTKNRNGQERYTVELTLK